MNVFAKISLLLFFFLGMIGCANNYYKEVSADDAYAFISGESAGGILKGTKAGILEINGQPVDNLWKGYGAKRRIEPGKTFIYVEAYLPGLLTAQGVLEFLAVANKSYEVTYENNVKTATLILYEEETKETIVTVEAEKTKKSESGSFIPIFIY